MWAAGVSTQSISPAAAGGQKRRRRESDIGGKGSDNLAGTMGLPARSTWLVEEEKEAKVRAGSGNSY